MFQTKSQQHHAQVLSERLEEYCTARRNLVQQLEELDTQARATQLELNSLRNSIAPIASLPEEVLATVFEAGTHLNQEKGLHFGLLVSHVIRSWRNTALATPRLWASIRCNKRDGGPYPEAVIDRTVAFLARSKSFPFKLYIIKFIALDSPLIQLLANHFGRCRHLSIINSYATPEALACFSRQPAPLLESLELGTVEGMAIWLTEPVFPSGVPHLKIAQINTRDVASFRICLAAFQSVTSLSITCIHICDDTRYAYTSFRDGLMALPSLGYLELRDSGEFAYSPWFPSNRLPVVLPALQVLDACSHFAYGFLNFLVPSIHAPSLTILTLGPGGKEVEDPVNVHFPSVKHLTLLGITRHIPGFNILGQFPSILRLTCSFHIITNDDATCGVDDILSALGPSTHEDENTAQ